MMTKCEEWDDVEVCHGSQKDATARRQRRNSDHENDDVLLAEFAKSRMDDLYDDPNNFGRSQRPGAAAVLEQTLPQLAYLLLMAILGASTDGVRSAESPEIVAHDVIRAVTLLTEVWTME